MKKQRTYVFDSLVFSMSSSQSIVNPEPAWLFNSKATNAALSEVIAGQDALDGLSVHEDGSLRNMTVPSSSAYASGYMAVNPAMNNHLTGMVFLPHIGDKTFYLLNMLPDKTDLDSVSDVESRTTNLALNRVYSSGQSVLQSEVCAHGGVVSDLNNVLVGRNVQISQLNTSGLRTTLNNFPTSLAVCPSESIAAFAFLPDAIKFSTVFPFFDVQGDWMYIGDDARDMVVGCRVSGAPATWRARYYAMHPGLVPGSSHYIQCRSLGKCYRAVGYQTPERKVGFASTSTAEWCPSSSFGQWQMFPPVGFPMFRKFATDVVLPSSVPVLPPSCAYVDSQYTMFAVGSRLHIYQNGQGLSAFASDLEPLTEAAELYAKEHVGADALVAPASIGHACSSNEQGNHAWFGYLYTSASAPAQNHLFITTYTTNIHFVIPNAKHGAWDDDQSAPTYYTVIPGSASSHGSIVAITSGSYNTSSTYNVPSGALMWSAASDVTQYPYNQLFDVSSVNNMTVITMFVGSQVAGDAQSIRVMGVDKNLGHGPTTFSVLADIAVSTTHIPRFAFDAPSMHMMVLEDNVLYDVRPTTAAVTNHIVVSSTNVTCTPAQNVHALVQHPTLAIDASSTTHGMAPPKGTTAERPTNPPVGTWRFNTDDDKMEYYNASGVWVQF